MEFERTNVKSKCKWNADEYPNSGFFNNMDDNGLNEVIYVNKETNYIVTLETPDLFRQVANGFSPTQKRGTVSEEFALKLVAVASGRHNDVEL